MGSAPLTSTPLHLLASTSVQVAATSKRTDKTALLSELFSHIEPSEVEIVVGLMLGEQRQGRIGIGWATVAALELTPVPVPSLTVHEIDEMLTAVAGMAGEGSVARRADALRSALNRATEVEVRFIQQVLVGELRQGALAGVISDGIAVAAGVKKPLLRRATMLRGDLAATAAVAMSDGTTGLEAITLEVLRPIEPMLASTAESATAAVDAIGTSSVEWKLDGARIQVHRLGNDVRVFTRNLNDITERVPGIVAIVRGFDADPLVLDGEILGLDADGAPWRFKTPPAPSDRTARSSCSRSSSISCSRTTTFCLTLRSNSGNADCMRWSVRTACLRSSLRIRVRPRLTSTQRSRPGMKA